MTRRFVMGVELRKDPCSGYVDIRITEHEKTQHEKTQEISIPTGLLTDLIADLQATQDAQEYLHVRRIVD